MTQVRVGVDGLVIIYVSIFVGPFGAVPCATHSEKAVQVGSDLRYRCADGVNTRKSYENM